MMDMTMAKPKVIICGKLLGRVVMQFLFLDSLDHEVKKQNVYITVVSIVQLLSLYGQNNDGSWERFCSIVFTICETIAATV